MKIKMKHVSITTLKNSLAEHMKELTKGDGFIITNRGEFPRKIPLDRRS
jgi:antitoxin (DNA-binding transcriptional repressor) of toxin-antitoxin stability system